MKKVAVHQPEYFPCLPLVWKIMQADVLVLLDDVQFKRDSLLQRAWVCGVAGAGRWMTIPFTHQHPQAINEVEIADPKWGLRHEGILHQLYCEAPRFDDVMRDVKVVTSMTSTRLSAVTEASVRVLLELLKVDRIILRSSTFDVDGLGKSERVLALCKGIGADTYVSGKAGADYLNREQFEAEGIRIEVPVFPGLKTDRQPDIPWRTSALDALMWGYGFNA